VVKAPEERSHVFDDPRNVRLLIRVFFACCAVLLLLDLVVHRHASFDGGELRQETWFGFYGFYGFLACVLLVLVAKGLRRVLGRAEDYYGPPQPVGEPEDGSGPLEPGVAGAPDAKRRGRNA
jgi:hypothetical protein